MLLAKGQIYAKIMAFYVPIGCATFARHCGKMYTCHLFPYGGFNSTRTFLVLQKILKDLLNAQFYFRLGIKDITFKASLLS